MCTDLLPYGLFVTIRNSEMNILGRLKCCKSVEAELWSKMFIKTCTGNLLKILFVYLWIQFVL